MKINDFADVWKQTQYKANTNPIQTQYEPNTNPISSKAKMNANAFSQKDYENETAFKPQKNKPNSNPIPEMSK